MQRPLTGLILTALLLAGCAGRVPGPQDSGLYHSPARAYSLALDSSVFRGAVTLTEQCDMKGGTLNIWDGTNRFFRIDYLKIGEHALADVPSFASERTVTEQVLNNYLRVILPQVDTLKRSEVLLSEFVETGRGDAMFSVVNIELKEDKIPDGVTGKSFYYGILVFTRGDFVYVVQHRVDSYQPDKLKQLLSGLRQDMLVPGVLRGNTTVNPAQATEDMKAKGGIDQSSIVARCGG
ncbi:MAG: hypothetical protein Q8J78_07680 [Moraxellaceae bacterium]|nr:hypothetical protein [Moraxellaceae bacterium]